MVWSYNALPDLTEQQYQDWLTLLEERTGISFERHRLILQTGLAQRMREVECDDYDLYFHRVSTGKSGALEWAALLKTLTVKETRFFRDGDALEYVRKYLNKRLLDDSSGRSLEIWSVASSTGEEPYSLAMLANDCIDTLGVKKFFGVTATDICLASLAEARKGVYPARRVETLPRLTQDRYFEEVPSNNALQKKKGVVASLKQRVCFVQANIIELDNLPVADMDVIYCQNVLIYFKRWRQKAVLDELVERLKPGGLLVVGMGEAVDWSNSKLKRVDSDRVQAYIRVAS